MQLRAEACRRELDGIRVLVVDDEDDIRQIVATVVTEYGAQARCASSAAQARRLLGETRFDVLLSDINMPNENGYELMRSIRHSPGASRALPSAAMTARLGPQDLREISAAGFDSILAKPFDLGRLVASVVELSQIRR